MKSSESESDNERRPPGDAVARQIAALPADPGRPLIISDADEVIADFMGGFEPYMEGQGFYFNWASYRLNQNIRHQSDDSEADMDDVRGLISGFYIACIDTLAAVDGAVEALGALANRSRIVVLSNQPFEHQAQREGWLERLGIGFPLVVNAGPKGPAVRMLCQGIEAPAYFLDDSPQHHTSVAAEADHVQRIHFVANPGLAPLIKTAPDCHQRVASWAGARAFIEADLAAKGY